MKLLHIVDKKPKVIIKLDPLDEEDFNISHEAVSNAICRSKNGVRIIKNFIILSCRMEWQNIFAIRNTYMSFIGI